MSDYEVEDDYVEEDYNPEEENPEYNQIEENTGEYELLKADGFAKKRDEQIEEFMEYSSLPRDEAEIVLISYQWNFEKLTSVWYENVESNKIKCGIEMSQKAKEKAIYPNDGTCPICYSELDNNSIGLKCNHKFCKDCYTEYLQTRLVDDPLTIIASPCPLKDCNLIVTFSIFEQCLKSDTKSWNKYHKFLLKNYTEANSDIKWCPNPNCGICIRVPGHGMKEIKCQCGTVFCFKCLRETHRPCDCEMITQWERKNNSNSENVKWLLLNTKQCPKCHKYIEKNQGCNHMTCQKKAGGCGYEFCWICLGEWKKHGTSYYKCDFKKEDDPKKTKEMSNTKFELERYVNYFEQYMNHDKAQKLAIKLIPKIEEYKELLSADKNVPFLELQFLNEAINTVIDCRRMLKNSYVFGYYLKQCKEIALYEHLQSLLDSNTDRLHEMLEKNEIPDLISTTNIEEFNALFMGFRNKLINLMASIQTYKSNLLNDIENKMINLINYVALNSDFQSK